MLASAKESFCKIKSVILLILTFSLSLATSADTSAVQDIENKIENLILPYIMSNNFSGNVLVVKGSKTIFHKAFGMANYELSAPVKLDTKFRIQSISKAFTAASILLLQESGMLNVNDPVSKHIPDYPDGDIITVHHLLTHTSGLPRIVFFPDYPEIVKKQYSTEQVVDLFKDKPLTSEPGEKFGYSNANYALLAYILQKASNMDFGEFLKKNIFDKLDMNNTLHSDGGKELISNRAALYEVTGIKDIQNISYANISWGTGAASLLSTTGDLYKWITGLLSGKILKPGTLDLMLKKPNYGWNINEMFGHTTYAFNGWGLGSSTNLTHFPVEDLTVIILSNIEVISLKEEMARGIAATVLKEKFSPIKIDPNAGPVHPSLLKKLTGTYKFGKDFYNPGGEMPIVAINGYLFESQEKANSIVGLLQVSKLEFVHRKSWGLVKFDEDENGNITGLHLYGRFRAEKVK